MPQTIIHTAPNGQCPTANKNDARNIGLCASCLNRIIIEIQKCYLVRLLLGLLFYNVYLRLELCRPLFSFGNLQYFITGGETNVDVLCLCCSWHCGRPSPRPLAPPVTQPPPRPQRNPNRPNVRRRRIQMNHKST